jgi:hypothetical protein
VGGLETEDLESVFSFALYYHRSAVIDTQPTCTIKFRARFQCFATHGVRKGLKSSSNRTCFREVRIPLFCETSSKRF